MEATMKYRKKFIGFLIIAVTLQLIILIYLNNYKLRSLDFFNSEDIKSQLKEDSVAKVLVPDNIDKVICSFNGEFSAYYNNYSLFVINTQTGIRKKIGFSKNNVINIYKWHPTKSKVVLAQQAMSQGASSLKLIVYDADLGTIKDLKDLSWLANNIRVEDLDFIGESDLVVKIAYANGNRELYFVGDEVNKLSTVSNNIGYIKYTGQEDKVLYEDEGSGKYYITGSSKEVMRDKIGGKIIHIDREGNIYMAEGDQREISNIYYRDLFDEKSSWQSIELGLATSIDNIYIDSQGQIYVNDPQGEELEKIGEKNTFKYEGKLMTVYREGILVIKDNLLTKLEFKDLINSEEK
jgi:hypothetical protein